MEHSLKCKWNSLKGTKRNSATHSMACRTVEGTPIKRNSSKWNTQGLYRLLDILADL